MKYLHEINCIRGIAIIFVLFRHTGVFTYADLGKAPTNFFDCLTLFAVPLFFFLSGFSLTTKYKDVKKINLKDYYKRRFKYLAPAYLFWVFSFQFITQYGNAIFTQGLNFSVVLSIRFFLEFLIQYVIVILTGNILTLWFILVIFQYYLIFPFLLKLYIKLNFYYKQFLMITIFILTIIIYLLGNNTLLVRSDVIVYSIPSSFTEINVDISNLLYFIPFFIYFILGINISFYWEKIKENIYYSRNFKILILLLFFLSTIALPFLENLIIPTEIGLFAYFSIGTLMSSIITIFFLLMIFNLRKIYEQYEKIDPNENNNHAPSNSKQKLHDLFFEGRISGQFTRFFWFVGHYSLGLYLSQRIILKLITFFFLSFGIDISPMQEGISRFSAFSYAWLNFFLIFIIGVSLTKILWKIPKGYYIIGERSNWLINYNYHITSYYKNE